MERVSLPVWLEYSHVRAELAARRPSRQPSHPDSPVLLQSFRGEQSRPSLLQAAVSRLREDCYQLKGGRRQLSQDWSPPSVKPPHRRVASNKSTQVSPRPQPILSDISSILETADFNDVSFAQSPVDEKQYCFISKWQPRPYLLKAREKGGKLVTCEQPGRLLELGVPLHSAIQVTAAGITGGLRLWVGSAKISSGERLVRVLASAHCVFLSPREVLCSEVLPTALIA